MCFTPTISFLTFTIEWILAIIVISRPDRLMNGNKQVYKLSALILFLLGAYQFTEFMLCISGNAELWGRAGFLAYNFLPVLGFHLASLLVKNRQNLGRMLSFYLIPVFFSSFALLPKDFITYGKCSTYFIIVEHSWNSVFAWTYGVYYFLFIILAALMLWDAANKQGGNRRKALLAGYIGTLAFTLPTFVLIILFPALKIMFPSVLCGFAPLYAISVFLMIHFLEKKR